MALPAVRARARRTRRRRTWPWPRARAWPPLYAMVPGVDAVIPLSPRGALCADGGLAAGRRAPGGRALRTRGAPAQFVHGRVDRGQGRASPSAGAMRPADAAASSRAACRGRRGLPHQADYYLALVAALGLPAGRRGWRRLSCPPPRGRPPRRCSRRPPAGPSWCWRRAPPTAGPSSGRRHRSRRWPLRAVARARPRRRGRRRRRRRRGQRRAA